MSNGVVAMSLHQGSETRTTIAPTSRPSGIGALGSSYNPANAMKRPDEIGVHVGDSMDDVINAVKGVGFYTDQIGFGAPSTGLTNGMPLKPLGVNYFMRTGQKCSNGAGMWTYMQGIPDGSALGTNVQTALNNMGLPPLKGLAPGMLEDMEHALNPGPLMNALFGSGYAKCKKVTLPVGDAYGRIKDSTTGDSWINDPETATFNGSMYQQTRWVQDTDYDGNPISLTKEEFDAEPKTYQLDGTPAEGFEGMEEIMTRPSTIAVVGVLCLLAFAFVRKR
jgi:hypothetical protein